MTAASVVIRQNRYIRKFRQAGATSPETARTPAELGVRESWLFRRMADAGVFVDAGGGRYYLDAEETERYLDRRWMRLMVVTIIGLRVLALVLMNR